MLVAVWQLSVTTEASASLDWRRIVVERVISQQGLVIFGLPTPKPCCRSNTLADVSRHPGCCYRFGEHITRWYPQQQQQHRAHLKADEPRSARCKHAQRSAGRCWY